MTKTFKTEINIDVEVTYEATKRDPSDPMSKDEFEITSVRVDDIELISGLPQLLVDSLVEEAVDDAREASDE